MQDIQIIVPLSALPDDIQMTPQSILSAFVETHTLLQKVENLELKLYQTVARHNQLVAKLNANGRNLERILDEVDDQFAKAQALRNLAAEMKEEKVMEL
jgi:hypothetical protein